MSNDISEVLIVGSGFAGLAMGIRLKQAKIDDFLILEDADDLGGTWRDNHYPGAACDVPSHLYSFSFEPNPHWSRSYASQSEILQYLRHCADKYGLAPHFRFNTRVTRASFDERAGLWTVESSDGKTRRARVVVSGCGALSRPSLPEIVGLSSFEGKVFHSARWDHSFSLEGKAVGVIGTGASAIQIVPAIAPKVRALHLFQRTPPWIVEKVDRAIHPLERAIFRRSPRMQNIARWLVYWGLEWRAMAFTMKPSMMTKFAEPEALKYLAACVRDPELRAKLTPKYTMGCKRVLLSNEYFEALQRENVELVTGGIEQIVPSGIKSADGRVRALDALVLATGFQAAEQVAPFEVVGKGGRVLDREWEDGAEAYLGTTISGFPNMYLLIGPNTGLGHSSMVFMIESQVQYVLSAIQNMRSSGVKYFDVKEASQRQYNGKLQERLAKTVWSTGGCTSWYTTRSGKNTTLWPGFTFEFRLRTRKFDREAYNAVEGVRES